MWREVTSPALGHLSTRERLPTKQASRQSLLVLVSMLQGWLQKAERPLVQLMVTNLAKVASVTASAGTSAVASPAPAGTTPNFRSADM